MPRDLRLVIYSSSRPTAKRGSAWAVTLRRRLQRPRGNTAVAGRRRLQLGSGWHIAYDACSTPPIAVGYGADAFPTIYVLGHGGYYICLVALFFTPTHISFRAIGYRLVDRVAPLPGPESPDFQERLERRAAIEEMLQVKETVEQRLTAGVAILSPVLGGSVAILIG